MPELTIGVQERLDDFVAMWTLRKAQYQQMPLVINRLTDCTVRNATAADTPKTLSDGAGQFLLVAPSGGKYRRLA